MLKKEISKKCLQTFIRIGGCKAVGKETARLTGVNETTVSKIWNRNPENSPNLGESVIRATRESVDETDSVLWSACIRHVIDVEISYLRNTEVPQLIINLNDEDEDDEEFF
jgi:hypothetical protein